MSFSTKVKEELLSHSGKARHCQIAACATILKKEGYVSIDGNDINIYLQTDNVFSVRKCFTILQKAFNIETDILENDVFKCENGRTYKKLKLDTKEAKNILMALKELGEDKAPDINDGVVSPLLLRNQCCKRAFIRNMFICVGSISDPKKSYHAEFVCDSKEESDQLIEILADFDLEAKTIRRKKYFVVYLKEGEEIVDLLNIMEAHVCLMEFENLRIYKDMRNSVNRRVNCETANIAKTATAAARQIEDIKYIEEHYGLNKLSDGLLDMANARLTYPDASLQELGTYLTPPVGKSGVNHRLRKLSEIADKLRG